MYAVTVNPKHPRKAYRKAGILFTDAQTILEELPDALEAERSAAEAGEPSWLVIEEIFPPPVGEEEDATEGEGAPEGPPHPNYSRMNLQALRDLCTQRKVSTRGVTFKRDLVKLLEEFDAENREAVSSTQSSPPG